MKKQEPILKNLIYTEINMTNQDIYEKLQKKLKNKRFIHTIGVAYTAANLAYRYNEDSKLAFRAGLLHDCAKYMNDEEMLKFCKKNNIEISDVEKVNPGLLHAKAGEYIARNDYGESDEGVLSAIRWHTTGRVGMSLLEKIVFVADYIEPNRNMDVELELIRQTAYSDLDKCITIIYENTLKYIKGSNKHLDPTTTSAYEYYRSLQ